MKEWKVAEIIELDMFETEATSFTGEVPDGFQYNVDCTDEMYDMYS